ncbi:MAG: hypothetical protein GX902_01465 [Lentisphaerae bacterium]|nr:hypothetical protein [Lentisphaerota bacterium]
MEVHTPPTPTLSAPAGIRQWLKNHPDAAWKILFALAVLLVFGRCLLAKDRLSDDVLYIGRGELLRFNWTNICYWWKTPILGLRSPLLMYSYMLDRLLWGEKLFSCGCHLQNLVWHVLCCSALYRLARMLTWRCADGSRLRLPRIYAGLMVLVWALHPQRVESVVWMAERKDGLSTFLGLWALILFIRASRREKISWGAVLLLFLSLLVKPMFATLPALAALFLLFDRQKIEWRSWIKLLLPMSLLILGYVAYPQPSGAALHTEMAKNISGLQLYQRLQISLNNYGLYFCKTFVPLNLSPLYPHYNPELDSRLPVVILAAVFALVLGLSFRREYRQMLLGAVLPGLLAFLVALLPVVGLLVSVGNTDFADRYSYFPSMFLLLLCAFLLYAWCRHKQWSRPGLPRVLLLFVVAYLILMVVITSVYMPVWLYKNENLYATVYYPLNPNPSAVKVLIGSLLWDGQDEEAVQLCREKLRENPHYARNISKSNELFRKAVQAIVLFRQQKPKQAMAISKEIFFDPEQWTLNLTNSGVPHILVVYVGEYFTDLGEDEAAAFVYECGANMYAFFDSYVTAFFRGYAAFGRKQYAQAAEHFAWAHRVCPEVEGVKQMLDLSRQWQNLLQMDSPPTRLLRQKQQQ